MSLEQLTENVVATQGYIDADSQPASAFVPLQENRAPLALTFIRFDFRAGDSISAPAEEIQVDSVAGPVESEVSATVDIFMVEQKEEVRSFLLDHPGLCGVLHEGKDRIAALFGDSEVALQVSPPEPGENSSLWMLVHTTLSATEASAAIDRLEESWWSNVSPSIRRLMAIDVEFLK